MNLLALPSLLLVLSHIGAAPGPLPICSAPEPGPVVNPRAAADLVWEADFDAALQRAAEEARVVFVAVNMDGERANDLMVKEVYRDKRIRALSLLTVNLIASADVHSKGDKCSRFDGVSCDHHRLVDVSVREKVLKGDASGAVVAPHHVFLGPDGEVLLSVAYQISADELEWCFHKALDLVEETLPEDVKRAKRPKKSRKERRPRRMILGDVLSLGDEYSAPITKDEAVEIISEIRKGPGKDKVEAMLRRLVAADEPEAVDFVISVMRAGQGGGRGGGGGSGLDTGEKIGLMRWIGASSPRSYWEVAAEFADSGVGDLQKESVVALEQLGAPEALPMLLKALRRSNDYAEQKNIVRAIGASSRGDKKGRGAVLKATLDRKSPLLRANAILALGWCDPEPEVLERLHQALDPAAAPGKAKIDGDKLTVEERVAAAVAMGMSQRPEWKEVLQGVLDGDDAPAALKDAATASIEVLDGGRLSLLTTSMRLAGTDEIPRDRHFPELLVRPAAPGQDGADGEAGQDGGDGAPGQDGGDGGDGI